MRLILFLALACFSVLAVAENVVYGSSPTGPQPFGVNTSGQASITLLAGEDQTNNVLKVESQFSVCIDDADIVCKASAGFVHSVWCFETDIAPTAGTVRIKNATSAAGAETTEVWGKDITTAVGSGTREAILDITMSTGITIDFTTTADVKCGVSYR